MPTSNTQTPPGIITPVRKGESFPFSFDLVGGSDDNSIDDWVCTIEVKKFPGDTASISRVITPTGSVWSGFLTQAETSALAIGTYRLIGVLTNSTTDEEQQIPVRFNITDTWAT